MYDQIFVALGATAFFFGPALVEAAASAAPPAPARAVLACSLLAIPVLMAALWRVSGE